MQPETTMASTLPPAEGSYGELSMDDVHGYEAFSEETEPDQMQLCVEVEQEQMVSQISFGGEKPMLFPFVTETPDKVEGLMGKGGISYGNLNEPADYSSDEECIARSKAILMKDITAAVEAFSLGYQKELVHNCRRNMLDEGYGSEDASD